MKEDVIKFLDKVSEMRKAQKAFFDARKRHDIEMSGIYLSRSKKLEKEVDSLFNELNDKIKNGEQKELF